MFRRCTWAVFAMWLAGCHHGVENFVGQPGEQHAYGFWFGDDNDHVSDPQDYALMALAHVDLRVQYCDAVAAYSCSSKPDSIVPSDPTIVATDGIVPYADTDLVVPFTIRGLHAGQTELVVFSRGQRVDSVQVTIADAPRPRFLVSPQRVVSGRYTIGAAFDETVRPLIGDFNDAIARSSGSITIPPGHVGGGAPARWTSGGPPSVGITFDVADGPGALDVGSADIATVSLTTTAAKTIVATVVDQPSTSVPGLVAVSVSDDVGAIDGATCDWTNTDGLTFQVTPDTELGPAKQYWVNAIRPGTFSARCAVGAAFADVMLSATAN